MKTYLAKAGIFIGLIVLIGCTTNPNIADEVEADYTAPPSTFTAKPLPPLTPDELETKLFGGGSNRIDPRLPGYAYFQGLIHTENHVSVLGQVRVVGGLVGATQVDATASLYNGAMITTNANAFLGAGRSLTGGPPGVRTRITKWEEIPNP